MCFSVHIVYLPADIKYRFVRILMINCITYYVLGTVQNLHEKQRHGGCTTINLVSEVTYLLHLSKY